MTACYVDFSSSPTISYDYNPTAISPRSATELGGVIYVGTTSHGVRQVVGGVDSLFGTTNTIASPQMVTAYNGNLYVGDFAGSVVYDITSGTPVVFATLPAGPFAGKPMFNPDDGSMWLSDLGADLYEFDASGNYVATHVHTGRGIGFGQWYDGLLYLVVGVGPDEIVVFDPTTATFSLVISREPANSVGQDLVVVGDRIYHGDRTTGAKNIWSVALDGSDFTVHVPNGIGSYGMTENGVWMYVADRDADRILRWPIVCPPDPVGGLTVGFLRLG